ncbi:tyrosine-type recombinase/integrase [Luteolibacter algae]|uniref:Tyrosine-type recombinase/integrase n=1 Tax=Luteolibacter algae TaxID=454151 RepID=A0ABW5D8X9_9BACT
MILNETKIRKVNSNGKAIKLNDGDGLYLLVHANGSKYWQFRYAFAGKAKVLSIGKYPEVSLVEARDRKIDAQRLLRDFIDPSSHKLQQKMLVTYQHRNTFFAVAEEWLNRNKVVWTPRHADRTWRRLEIHVFPDLGKRPISEIKPMELLWVIQKIEATGVTDTCVRILKICSAIFRFGIVTGRLEHNPALNLRGALKPYRETHFPALKARELPSFLGELDKLNTSEQNKIAFRTLLMTAVRSGELRHSRWEDVDLEAGEWRIPAEMMKMREEHIVPLSSQVISLLEQLRAMTGNGPWLFPSQQGRVHAIMSENTINSMIRRMGYKGKVVGHGFRSMFSTTLNEHGFNRDAIERQLAHMERNGVRAAYNRAEYLPERRFMMQWWADFIESRGKAAVEFSIATRSPVTGTAFQGFTASPFLN